MNEIPFTAVPWGQSKVLVDRTRWGANHLLLRVTEYAPGVAHELHSHPNQEEIIFVLEGEGYSKFDGKRHPLGPGSVVFIPAGLEHATANTSNRPLRALVAKSPPD